VIELYRHRADSEKIAGLPDPWKLLLGRPAKSTEEDLAKSVALAIGPALIQVEEEAPR
jgi:hypothetical protein